MAQAPRNQVLAVLFVGVLMGAIDIAIVGPALPAIQAQFELDSRAVSWIFSIYVLANLIGTPLMAKLSDNFGRRAIYLLDVALFAVGSLVVVLSGISGGFALLLVGRAIQGFGAGGIFPVASAVIGDTFPPERRGGALGLIGAVFGIAFVIGPILGGLLLMLGWQWLFGINLPIAAVVMVLAWRVLPHQRLQQGVGFDWLGMTLLAGALGSLAYGLVSIDVANFGASLASAGVWGWLLVSASCWVALIAVERGAANPVFPIALFARRQLRLGYTLTAGAGLGEASLVFMPSLAVAALGVSSGVASFLLMPVVLAMSVGSPLAGRMLDRFGSRTVIVVGVAIMAVGMLLLSQTAGVLAMFIVSGVLIGFGMSALLGAPIRYVTLNETTAAERSSAQGLVNTFTSVGQLLGAALVGAVAASSSQLGDGYRSAYAFVGVLGVALLVAAVMLKSRADEAKPAPVAETATNA
ncbi:MFS transporter [Propionicimonas sp.]|uniref:MFS transporter n=1 Tax=Propionicimonas sp. TaxID=1955623 RepID=UPI001823471F|nr:MFS transporter [Propionicimonas sp.]MBU3977764.1 MFS transporter [Actinomycetota bacterium]MBA3021687.1 MFS transporter [Propionicimonas sp.]MBU3987238.1 MFS transporter [Actinomycetota bacterium]MBU4009059.1 MFS transporter [Actinomycetota bacterium]MBU4065791.1 MFS transporter [Actinomycetota bacterium]